jgi:excisionase family DNA binding protein
MRLPVRLGDIDPITLPEFMPDDRTMTLFKQDRDALWRACNRWIETIRHPPVEWTDEFDCEFAQLTRTLQLWASLHGLGDSTVLSGKDLGQALAFIDLIRDRSGLPVPAAGPTGLPQLVNDREAAKVLDISTRTLWDLKEAEVIPYVHVGRQVRYNLNTLRRWIEANERYGQYLQ